MGTVLWIFLLFYVANGRVLAQEELYCTDPDTGLRYSVNSSWPATKFCGSYTCHAKSVQGLKHTEISEYYNDNEIHKNKYHSDETHKNEFSEMFHSGKYKDFNKMRRDDKMELNDKINKQSYDKNQLGNDIKKTLNKPSNGDLNSNADVNKPQFYNYNGQLHVIKNDPLLLEIFKEYNKYLAKFIEYYPHSMYKFNNLQNTKKIAEAEPSSSNKIDVIKAINIDDDDKTQHEIDKIKACNETNNYYDHWIKFYISEYENYKKSLESINKENDASPSASSYDERIYDEQQHNKHRRKHRRHREFNTTDDTKIHQVHSKLNTTDDTKIRQDHSKLNTTDHKKIHQVHSKFKATDGAKNDTSINLSKNTTSDANNTTNNRHRHKHHHHRHHRHDHIHENATKIDTKNITKNESLNNTINKKHSRHHNITKTKNVSKNKSNDLDYVKHSHDLNTTNSFKNISKIKSSNDSNYIKHSHDLNTTKCLKNESSSGTNKKHYHHISHHNHKIKNISKNDTSSDATDIKHHHIHSRKNAEQHSKNETSNDSRHKKHKHHRPTCPHFKNESISESNKKNKTISHLSYLYFDPKTGEYTAERPSDFTHYLKFYDDYMKKYLHSNQVEVPIKKLNDKKTEFPQIKSSEPKIQQIEKLNNFRHSEDTVHWKAGPYAPSGLLDLRPTLQDNKFDRINSKLAQLGLPAMPKPFSIPKLKAILPGNFKIPGFKTLTKRSTTDEENRMASKFQTYITVQGCPDTTEPGYFKMGDVEKLFPHCCPQKIDD